MPIKRLHRLRQEQWFDYFSKRGFSCELEKRIYNFFYIVVDVYAENKDIIYIVEVVNWCDPKPYLMMKQYVENDSDIQSHNKKICYIIDYSRDHITFNQSFEELICDASNTKER